MEKVTAIVLFGLMCATTSTFAHDAKMGMEMDFKAMDTNGDGMISKEEFMKFHEMMFDKMKKNKTGMVDVKDMEMMHHDPKMQHKGMPANKHDMKKDEKSK